MDRVRGGRVAMIFQDPASALNPVLKIGRQLGEALALHRGLSGSAIRHEARRLLDLVGIPDAARRLSAYPHEFSGGQNQRVMIAMALAGEPDLLVADEPTTALDVTIQAQILDLISAVRREMGMALVLISHDLGVVAETCDRVAVMYAGRIVEEAPARVLFDAALASLYARPALLASAARRRAPAPRLDPGHGARSARPAGRLRLRAALSATRVAACLAAPPRLAALEAGRRLACVNHADDRDRRCAAAFRGRMTQTLLAARNLSRTYVIATRPVRRSHAGPRRRPRQLRHPSRRDARPRRRIRLGQVHHGPAGARAGSARRGARQLSRRRDAARPARAHGARNARACR